MARQYSVESVFGENYQLEPNPEILAFELSMDFSDQIIARCNELGLTLSELARKIGIKPSTLSEKLNGQNLTLKSMARMAIAVGCDLEAPRLVETEKETVITNLNVPSLGSNPRNFYWCDNANPNADSSVIKLAINHDRPSTYREMKVAS